MAVKAPAKPRRTTARGAGPRADAKPAKPSKNGAVAKDAKPAEVPAAAAQITVPPADLSVPPNSIGGYLIRRLQEYGVADVFGIPGDFCLQF